MPIQSKNKAGEKLAESEEDLLEHRTDGTDAFDTLFIGCEKFPKVSTLEEWWILEGLCDELSHNCFEYLLSTYST